MAPKYRHSTGNESEVEVDAISIVQPTGCFMFYATDVPLMQQNCNNTGYYSFVLVCFLIIIYFHQTPCQVRCFPSFYRSLGILSLLLRSTLVGTAVYDSLSILKLLTFFVFLKTINCRLSSQLNGALIKISYKILMNMKVKEL